MLSQNVQVHLGYCMFHFSGWVQGYKNWHADVWLFECGYVHVHGATYKMSCHSVIGKGRKAEEADLLIASR